MPLSLGIFDGHNAAAVLCRDGRVLHAVQEERLSRTKNHYDWPRRAVAEVLRLAGVHSGDVERVEVASLYVPTPRDPRSLKEDFDNRYGFHPRRRGGALLGSLGPYRRLRERQRMAQRTQAAVACGLGAPVRFHDHHEAHAATAYYGLRGDDDPYLVITLDGGGDGLSGSVWTGQAGTLRRLAAVPQADSLGEVYAAVTHMLGFMPLEHEYKLMGMAPYCEAPYGERVADRFRRYADIEPQGPRIRRRVPEALAMIGPRLCRDLERVRFDAVCAGLQCFTEEMLTGWVRLWARRTGIRRVLAAGGVFMNVKANQAISQLDEVDTFAAFPSCGDESLPFGACWLGALADGADPAPIAHVYLGGDLLAPACRQAAAAAGDAVAVEEPEDMAERAADLLAAGHIVARAAGPMEFGARALGNRSILADPRNPDVVRVINRMIKKRDFWMPFAPVVRRRHADACFTNPKGLASPYMMNTFDSTARRTEFMAAVHNADLTARPQMVEAQQNPAYEAILDRFAARTGRHVLLNTSFNLHGLPIVYTAADAVRVLLDSGLERLILGPLLLTKRAGAAPGAPTPGRT